MHHDIRSNWSISFNAWIHVDWWLLIHYRTNVMKTFTFTVVGVYEFALQLRYKNQTIWFRPDQPMYNFYLGQVLKVEKKEKPLVLWLNTDKVARR